MANFLLKKSYHINNLKISKFKDLSKNNKFNDLTNIDGIGETQVNSIKNFFSNKRQCLQQN